MIEYFNRRGVEVTSEFIYREWRSGIRVHFGKSDTIGLISAFWNPVFSPRDILRYPAAAVGFGEQCNALTPFQSLEWLIYGNMHGEDLLHPEDSEWPQKFLKRFITYTVPALLPESIYTTQNQRDWQIDPPPAFRRCCFLCEGKAD